MKVRPIADKNDDECKACNISTQIILKKKRRVEKKRKEVVKTYLHIHNINSRSS